MKAISSLTLAIVSTVLVATSVPAFASEADDRIESSFKNTYVYKTYLKDEGVKVDAKNGLVTLTGTVSDQAHKALATDTAAGLPGVTSVNDKLATKAEVATEKADSWIDKKVTLALLFHRNVNSGKTTVDVKDGVVTLTGEASSLAQKELTTEYASDIEGVTKVNNEMTVASDRVPTEQTEGEKIDDASVTAQVKAALSTHRSTNALKTKVETRDGKVTLTGIARNDAEKSLVTKVVRDLKGVTDVDNRMTVEEIK